MFSIYYFRHCSIVFHFNIFPIVFKINECISFCSHLFPRFSHLSPSFASYFPSFSFFFGSFFSNLFPWPSFHLCTERRQTWSACGRKWIPSSTCGKNAAGLGHFRANKGFLSMAEKGIEVDQVLEKASGLDVMNAFFLEQ